MRAGLFGIIMGVSMAISLRNGKKLSTQVVSISILTELSTILILGLADIS